VETTKLYEDTEQTRWLIQYPDGSSCQTIEWKPGSVGAREEKIHAILSAALDSWPAVSASQKDKLLRLLCRLALERFDGE